MKKIFIANINKTHPYNFGDPPKKDYIRGAASACWKANYKELEGCEFLVAVYENKIVEAFKIKDIVSALDAEKNEAVLRSNIKYPPYRKYEIDAHICKTADEIKLNLGEYVSIFEKVVKVDIDNEKDFNNWKKRSFLILDDCHNKELNSLIGKTLPCKDIPSLRNAFGYGFLEEE